jgi:hypothetical protein
VELALKLLDEDEIRGYKLHVEVAKFQLKGEYDASKKKKKCKDYKKKLSLQQKYVFFLKLHRNILKHCFDNRYLVLFHQTCLQITLKEFH